MKTYSCPEFPKYLGDNLHTSEIYILCHKSFIKCKLEYRNISIEVNPCSLATEFKLDDFSKNTRKEIFFFVQQRMTVQE
jgi:hypothetical protein